MAKRQIRRAKGREFVGQRVAVAYNRHECLPSHPKKKGEHCFPVRAKPSSSSKVLAYADDLWLKDVSFFISPGGLKQIQRTGVRTVCCFVVGTVISRRPSSVTAKNGWAEIRLDVFDHGCFYRHRDGACVRTAKYARLHNRRIEAFGSRKGDPVTSMRDLADNPGPLPVPTYGPRRREWRGEMGGLNFDVAGLGETVEAIRWVHEQHPGCVIVDGTDDWDAPMAVRPEQLVCQYEIQPLAWWHTGKSGQARSGVVLSDRDYAELRRRYAQEYGVDLESDPRFSAPGVARPECGCWGGEGIRVYPDALSSLRR